MTLSNPYTGNPLSEEALDALRVAEEAIKRSKRAKRSGNPAIRAAAEQTLSNMPHFVEQTFRKDAL